MDDTISRQAAISEIVGMTTMGVEELVTAGDKEKFDWIKGLSDSLVKIINLPSAQAEPQWIPCSERLPDEEKKTYWVCTDAECQCECRWTNNRFGIGEGEWGWSIFDTPQYTKPIAWMELPEPYKEGDGE